MSDVRDLLFDYVAGALTADETRIVEKALAADPELRREFQELEESFHVLAGTAPPMDGTRPEVRERLLAEARSTGRFEPFVDKLAELFDIAVDKARSYLATIDDLTSWNDFAPGIRFQDFDGGASLAECRVGIVRLAPGAEFPEHKHIGQENVLVLQGASTDGVSTWHAGDRVSMPDGSSHVTRCSGSQELIYAVVVPDVEIGGVRLPRG